MLKNYLFLLICICSFWETNAQNNQEFSGTIVADSIAEIQVNIVNYTNKLGTVNAASGKFSIQASEGDKVIFSSVKYEPHTVEITSEMLQKRNNQIILFLMVNELEEVNISSLTLTRDLLADANNMELQPILSAQDLGIPIRTAPRLTVEERRLYTASSGGPIGVLIDVLSGRMEMLNRQKKYADLELLIQQSKHLVPNNFFVETLKIDPILIDDFLYFCSNQEEFKTTVNQKDPFVMIDFFRNQKTAYKKFKKENSE
ncbi:hypothetical protein ACFQ3R_08880 [Mesonia ostreae]|uniref:CarboxypepD_reg-like domain-containing protein n=1 Tax=Mesonia ostreae TaxID=861110 RepID=A0ABU2KET1_9FLAO|nr:hypothetical protein [Mesonia ostreae]MDT0293218.1 hypothetical protein [Mesonia ostreae]